MRGIVGSCLALVLATPIAASADGTLGLASPPSSITTTYPANAHHLPNSVLVLNPIDSVSMTGTQVWRDNRHRAYRNPAQGIDDLVGFLLFDVSAIPDNAWIAGMKLVCHLENGFASPFATPVVDIHYSPDDRWHRGSVPAGSLTHGELLLNDAPFESYVSTHEFLLNPVLRDWSGDLLDDRITLAFRNDAQHFSYVYFFGAGGMPAGPPPELHVQYIEPVSRPALAWGAVKALYR